MWVLPVTGVRSPRSFHPPASVSLAGEAGGRHGGLRPRRGVSDMRTEPLGCCIQPERGDASHSWPQESVRPKPPWIVLGDCSVSLGRVGIPIFRLTGGIKSQS